MKNSTWLSFMAVVVFIIDAFEVTLGSEEALSRGTVVITLAILLVGTFICKTIEDKE